MEEHIFHERDMSDVPENEIEMTINEINNNIDIQMNDDYNDNIHSENINMNFIQQNTSNNDSNNNNNNQNYSSSNNNN
jgi:hypothetical protein